MNDTKPNLSTALLLAAIFAAFFSAQTLDMTDNSAEFAQADALETALTDAQKQARKEAAAQYACGPQSAYVWINESTIECLTNRGRKAGQVEVAAK